MPFAMPKGTRGVQMSGATKILIKGFNKLMADRIGKSGRAFGSMPAFVLNTVGRKSGESRRTPLAYIPDAEGGWLIVAAYAGAVNNPAWYHNIAAHPDRVSIELDGCTRDVIVEELHGQQRDKAWQQIVAFNDRFAKYQQKTDRQLPVIRLSARKKAGPDVG